VFWLLPEHACKPPQIDSLILSYLFGLLSRQSWQLCETWESNISYGLLAFFYKIGEHIDCTWQVLHIHTTIKGLLRLSQLVTSVILLYPQVRTGMMQHLHCFCHYYASFLVSQFCFCKSLNLTSVFWYHIHPYVFVN